jgi:hypothetical protein
MIKTCLFSFLLMGILVSGTAQAAQGWYLLLPPYNNLAASIKSGRWEQIGAYDTAKECQRELVERQNSVQMPDKEAAEYGYKKLTGKLTAEDEARDKFWARIGERWSYAVCIASDDPRLK